MGVGRFDDRVPEGAGVGQLQEVVREPPRRLVEEVGEVVEQDARGTGVIARLRRGAGGEQRQSPVTAAPVQQAAQVPCRVFDQSCAGQRHGSAELRAPA